MSPKKVRSKLSTTVSFRTYEYLTGLVESGRVKSLAEAVDEAVEEMRKNENRRRLAQATAEYYASLSTEEVAEESVLAKSMHETASKIDFNREP